jgi:hypothetical protein
MVSWVAGATGCSARPDNVQWPASRRRVVVHRPHLSAIRGRTKASALSWLT